MPQVEQQNESREIKQLKRARRRYSLRGKVPEALDQSNGPSLGGTKFGPRVGNRSLKLLERSDVREQLARGEEV